MFLSESYDILSKCIRKDEEKFLKFCAILLSIKTELSNLTNVN